jgi:hypothetical protein
LHFSLFGGILMENRRGRGKRRKAELDRHACDPSPPSRPIPSRDEHLDYIADMLRELKAMSARVDCPGLTELLELAYRKAVKPRRTG